MIGCFGLDDEQLLRCMMEVATAYDERFLRPVINMCYGL